MYESQMGNDFFLNKYFLINLGENKFQNCANKIMLILNDFVNTLAFTYFRTFFICRHNYTASDLNISLAPASFAANI